MILLDTHILLWWIEDSGRLSKAALTAIAGSSANLVSPISFWELTVLVDRGRVEVEPDVARWCRDLLVTGVARVANLTSTVAISAARLPEFHGDPADRFIYATARELEIPLVSKDAKIREYASRWGDVKVIW